VRLPRSLSGVEGDGVSSLKIHQQEVFMDFDNAWEKIKKSVRDGAALSIEKIEEYSKVGKLKVEEFATKKKIERNFVDIGERVFELVESKKDSDIVQDATVKKAIANIESLKEELVSIEKKIHAVFEEAKKSKRKNESVDDINGI
jgi:hypothetical protein